MAPLQSPVWCLEYLAQYPDISIQLDMEWATTETEITNWEMQPRSIIFCLMSVFSVANNGEYLLLSSLQSTVHIKTWKYFNIQYWFIKIFYLIAGRDENKPRWSSLSPQSSSLTCHPLIPGNILAWLVLTKASAGSQRRRLMSWRSARFDLIPIKPPDILWSFSIKAVRPSEPGRLPLRCRTTAGPTNVEFIFHFTSPI